MVRTLLSTSLDAGASLRDLQDAMGHASPRTTRRYDRSRGNLDRSPGLPARRVHQPRSLSSAERSYIGPVQLVSSRVPWPQ